MTTNLRNFCLLFSLAGTLAFAQNIKKTGANKIPPTVVNAFHKDFPAAKDVEWEKEGANYEAGFVLNKQEISALYDGAGKKLETEQEIATAQLPAGAMNYIKTKKLGNIKEGSKIVKNNGAVEYEAEVKGHDYLFDANGKFLKIAED